MGALGSLLADEEKREFWRAYMAELAWCQAKAYYKDFPFPAYTEMTRKHQPEDERTGKEIIDDLIARLGGDA